MLKANLHKLLCLLRPRHGHRCRLSCDGFGSNGDQREIQFNWKQKINQLISGEAWKCIKEKLLPWRTPISAKNIQNSLIHSRRSLLAERNSDETRRKRFVRTSLEFFVKMRTFRYRCGVINENVIIKKTDGASRRRNHSAGLRVTCRDFWRKISLSEHFFFRGIAFLERAPLILHHRVTGWH